MIGREVTPGLVITILIGISPKIVELFNQAIGASILQGKLENFEEMFVIFNE
jgi:hypothetical protein